MNQAESLRVISLRKSFQPAQAFFTNHRKRRRNQILYAPKKWPKLRRFSRKFTQTLRRPKHLIRIPADSRPPQRTNLVDHLRRMSPAVSQIAALDHQVRRNLPQVRQHSLKRPKVPVNIRYDRGSHFASPGSAILPLPPDVFDVNTTFTIDISPSACYSSICQPAQPPQVFSLLSHTHKSSSIMRLRTLSRDGALLSS